MANDVDFVRLYVDQEMTLHEVSAVTGIPVSTLRSKLIKAGAMRSFKESQVLAGRKGRKGAHLIGKARPISDLAKQRMSAAKRAWAEKHAAGVSVKPSGYVEVTRGKHKFKRLHRVLMEEHLGRPLRANEVVHHIDGDKLNNAIENLTIMTAREHNRLHGNENHSKRNRTRDGRFA